jgi:hypothetical protein
MLKLETPERLEAEDAFITTMEVVSSPETSVDIYKTTLCNISEGSHLQI